MYINIFFICIYLYIKKNLFVLLIKYLISMYICICIYHLCAMPPNQPMIIRGEFRLHSTVRTKWGYKTPEMSHGAALQHLPMSDRRHCRLQHEIFLGVGEKGVCHVCGVYLITIVAAIRVHVRGDAMRCDARQCDTMRCNVAGTAATKSLQLTRVQLGTEWRTVGSLLSGETFFDVRGPFCAIILRSIIVKYFTKCVYLYSRIPRMPLPLRIANWPGSLWCHVHVLLPGLS